MMLFAALVGARVTLVIVGGLAALERTTLHWYADEGPSTRWHYIDEGPS